MFPGPDNSYYLLIINTTCHYSCLMQGCSTWVFSSKYYRTFSSGSRRQWQVRRGFMPRTHIVAVCGALRQCVVIKGAFGVRKLLTSRNETYGRIVGDIQRPNPETRGGHVLKALRFEDGKIHSFSAAFHSFFNRRKKCSCVFRVTSGYSNPTKRKNPTRRE